MHKGRPYPYHPTFWATEFAFWPHYLPWKIQWDFHSFISSSWTFLWPGFGHGVTASGVLVSPNAKTIRYLTTDFSGAYNLTFTFDTAIGLPVDHGRLVIEARIGAFLQAISRFDLGVRGTDWIGTHVGISQAFQPPFLNDPVGLDLGASPYSEGGSPWH